MTRRTRSQAQHSDLPPPPADPTQEQGRQSDLNDNHAEDVPEHRLGKEPMIIEADNGTNLGDLTCCTEQLEDVIGVVQTTVNQLNQFLIQATRQGIQLLINLAEPHQQAYGLHSGENRWPQKQADES